MTGLKRSDPKKNPNFPIKASWPQSSLTTSSPKRCRFATWTLLVWLRTWGSWLLLAWSLVSGWRAQALTSFSAISREILKKSRIFCFLTQSRLWAHTHAAVASVTWIFPPHSVIQLAGGRGRLLSASSDFKQEGCLCKSIQGRQCYQFGCSFSPEAWALCPVSVAAQSSKQCEVKLHRHLFSQKAWVIQQVKPYVSPLGSPAMKAHLIFRFPIFCWIYPWKCWIYARLKILMHDQYCIDIQKSIINS